jgi:hypothetical protein
MDFRPILMLAILPCAACSTIVSGTSQRVSVMTNPPGASCVFMREGQEIGRIDSTPGTISIQRTKYDVTVKCDKPGFQQASYLNHSGIEIMTAGNIAIGGLTGWAIDSASGADNRYDSAVNVSLVPAANGLSPAGRPAGTGATALITRPLFE